MRRLILAASILLAATAAGAVDYYGCNTGQNHNSNSLWCTYADLESAAPAACTKAAGGSYTAAGTAVQAGNNLYANGCTIAIVDSFTATKISTEDGGGGANDFGGGSFTLNYADVSGKTITANITAGTSDCLAVSGTGSVTNSIVGNVTGGTGSTTDGITVTHNQGTLAITGNVSGGSTPGSNAMGIYASSGSGTTTITGNVTGGASGSNNKGIYNTGASTTITVYGNATAGDTVTNYALHSLTSNGISLSGGSVIDKVGTQAIYGYVFWTPDGSGTDWDYHRVVNGAGPTYKYLTLVPAIAKVENGHTYGFDGSTYYTGTLVGGGGAWAF